MIWVLRVIAALAALAWIARLLEPRVRDALEPLGQTPHNRNTP